MTKEYETAPDGMNESAPGTEIGAKLTPPGSGFDLNEISSQLTRVRNRVGALTPAGHRCSNLLEMFDSLPPGAEDRIDYLTPDGALEQRANLLRSIAKQTAQLEKLLKAA